MSKLSDKYVQQFLATPASSCLTCQEYLGIGVRSLALNLSKLLLKPGYEFLNKLADLHAYYAWPRSLVLNCSDLNASNSDKFNLVSEVDGSKCSFTTHQLQTLITNLQTDLVLLPGGMVKDFAPSINYFVPYMEHKPGFGVYFVINDTNFSQMLGKVAEFSKEPKYIYADLSLDLYLQLCELPAIKIENSRFAVDAFQGDVYREGKVHSILDSDCEHEFLRLVADCACYTCSSGFTVAYLHHLFKHTPLLCQRLLILHNVFYASHLP